MAAFSQDIGCATNNKAKTSALFKGVQLAIDLDIKNLLIESDSSFIFYCICSQEHHPITRTLLAETKLLLQKCDRVTFNNVVDQLAKKRASMEINEESLFGNEHLCLKNLLL